MSTRLKWPIILAIGLLSSGLALIYISMNWVTVIDDTYIYFRYAQNIRNGYGYVFNIGQPVEGTTSIAWTILLVGFDYLNVPLVLATKILGVLSVLAVLAVLGIALDKRSVRGSTTVLVLCLLLFNPHFVPSIMMGLETGLFAVCVLVFSIIANSYLQTRGKEYGVELGAIGVLLFLTRPESIGILLIIGVGLIGTRLVTPRRYSLRPIAIWILGVSAITLWRWFTFGDYIPNSARAKSIFEFSTVFLGVLWPRIQAGMLYTKTLILVSPLLVIFGIFGLVALRKSYLGLVGFIVLCVGFGTVLLNSGDWMPFSRLLTSYLPLVALLAAVGMNHIQNQLGKSGKHIFELTSVLLTVAVIAHSFWLIRDRTPFVAENWPSGRCYEQVGVVLRPYLSQQTVIAPEAIGILGYAVDTVPILDFFGLTDAEIARHGTIPIETYTLGKHDYEYVMQRHPEIFLFHSHITNHIPLLNQWGYAQDYDTFSMRSPNLQCQLIIGLDRSVSPSLQPILSQKFELESIDVTVLQKSPAATWPFGEN